MVGLLLCLNLVFEVDFWGEEVTCIGTDLLGRRATENEGSTIVPLTEVPLYQ